MSFDMFPSCALLLCVFSAWAVGACLCCLAVADRGQLEKGGAYNAGFIFQIGNHSGVVGVVGAAGCRGRASSGAGAGRGDRGQGQGPSGRKTGGQPVENPVEKVLSCLWKNRCGRESRRFANPVSKNIPFRYVLGYNAVLALWMRFYPNESKARKRAVFGVNILWKTFDMLKMGGFRQAIYPVRY